MAIEVTKYLTDDGIPYDTMEEAEAHEAEQMIIDAIRSYSPNRIETYTVKIAARVINRLFTLTPKEQDNEAAQQ